MKNVRHLVDGRFGLDHTTRKGFWLEDFSNGDKYYFDNKTDIMRVVGLLNSFTSKDRFFNHDSNVGMVIEDLESNETFVLGDSSHLGKIKRLLNERDYVLNGKRTFAYRRTLM